MSAMPTGTGGAASGAASSQSARGRLSAGRRVRVLLGAVGLLWLGAALGLVLGPPEHPSGRALQRALGGFGLGSSVTSEWCFVSLDPRIESACPAELRPVPGLYCPTADHGAGLVAFELAPP
jgi:hypothetical protein